MQAATETGKVGVSVLQRIMHKAVAFGCLLFAAAFAYLAVFSLRYTCVFDPSAYLEEHILRVYDALLPNLLWMGLLITVLRLLSRWEKALYLQLMTALTIALPLIGGIAWACASQTIPRADQVALYQGAGQLIQGQAAVLAEPASYFQRLPYQLGQLLFFELVERMFGTQSYVPFYVINAVSLSLAYGAVLSILWQTMRDRRIQLCCCLLMMLFAPGILYCVFVYGLLPGLALALWAAERCVCWVRRRGVLRLLAALTLLCAACVVKINNLIPAVAALVTLLLLALHERKARFAVAALCMFLLPLGASALPQAIYAARAGTTFHSGAPQSAWLVMGMQEGPRAAGWYNSYPWTVLEAAGFDEQQADALIHADLQTRLSELMNDPLYAVQFFHAKLTSQWGETTFESLWINKAGKHADGRSAMITALLADDTLSRYMDTYANTLYLAYALGLAAIAWRLIRNQGLMEIYGLLFLIVAVFGGFLYHLLFEAKSQYLLPYAIMMMPIAAVGLMRLPAILPCMRSMRAGKQT